MTYFIILIVVLVIMVLFLLFYSPKYKPDQEQKVTTVDELAARSSAAAAEADTGEEEVLLTLDDQVVEPEPEFGLEDHELELTFEGPAEQEGPELDLAPPGEPVAVADEHFELTLDEEELTETGEESPAALADEGSPAAEPAEGFDLEEDIPFIDEEGETAPALHEEVAPALAGFGDEGTALEEEETPEDLAERLDFFFGSDEEEAAVALDEPSEEGPPAAEETEEEQAEAVAEEVVEAAEAAAEIVLSREQFEEDLRRQEEKLRRDLEGAIDARETAGMGLLERGLLEVCAKQADLDASLARQQVLAEEVVSLLDKVQEKLPGFQADVVRTNLYGGEPEVVRSLMGEAAEQVDDAGLVARTRYLAGRLAEEEAGYEEAYELFRSACEGDAAQGEYLFAAGHAAMVLGDDEAARQWLERSVEEGVEVTGKVAARARHELARLCLREDDKDQAESLLKEAMAAMEQEDSVDAAGLGQVAHDLAALYESSGMYEQAEPLYKKAIEVMEKGLGSDHPYLGATCNKLAGLYEEIEMEEQSEPLYARALEIRKRVLGDNHPDVGTVLNNLANLYKQKGKYEQAEPMFLQSLSIAEKALGKDHPNLAVVLNNLAELYGEMGNDGKAEHFQERAFALFELPGGGGDFVEMEKDHEIDIDDEMNKTIT